MGLHLPPFLGNVGATERKRSYLEVGPKKGTAVPLPIHRLGLTPPIPFTAALKPLELCYTQLRKTRAICRDNAAATRETSADTRSFMRVTYEVGPSGPFARLHQRETGRFKRGVETVGVHPFFAPAARAARSRAPQSAKLPARKGRIASQLVCTTKRLPRKGLPPGNGECAHAPRLHQRTDSQITILQFKHIANKHPCQRQKNYKM